MGRTNRQKYFLQRDEYDILISIRRRGWHYCPIEIIGADRPVCVPDKDYIHDDCDTCIQRWLNEEADG
jgi:hypothetical protein